MSKEQPQTKEELLEEARKLWDENAPDHATEFCLADYTSSDTVDVIIVFEDMPYAIVPNSERAKKLFMRWGMEEGLTGIAPPNDAMDLIRSMPQNWVCEMQELANGAHLIKEVPLPQPILVVH